MMVQEPIRIMGLIHSTHTHRAEPSSPNDLRLVRLEVEKLFAMDSHHHVHHHKKSLPGHNQQQHQHHNNNRSNRWNLLRFLENANRSNPSDVTTTATSSCSSSPVFPQLDVESNFHHHQRRRYIVEDTYEKNLDKQNITSITSPQRSQHDSVEYDPEDGIRHYKKESEMPIASTGMNEVRNTGSRHSRSTLDDSTNGTNSAVIPESNGRSRPIPVTRRRVSPLNTIHHEETYQQQQQHDDDDEMAEEHHLKQIYDLRTWEMYIRISEARKKTAQSKLRLVDHRSNSCITSTTAVANTAAATTTTIPTSRTTLLPTSTLPQPCGGPQLFLNSRSIHMIPFLPKEETIRVPLPPSIPSSTPLLSEHEMIFGDLDD